jgi:pyridinium-3,5-bisthiocarboxylic acid mononucleotide nickel chelatase
MSNVLFVDVIGGAAGDMLLAALVDAGAPESVVREAVEAVLPGRFEIRTEEVERAGIRARWLLIEAGPMAAPAPQQGRKPQELVDQVTGASLPSAVADLARRVLLKLAEAEAVVHGVSPHEVVLHELGDDDTLLDVVGVAAAVHALRVERLYIGSLPIGLGGTAPGRDDHPDVPLPAPVTLELLRGFDLRGATRRGEHVTPTAAGIFAALGEPVHWLPEMTLEAIGYGAGTRDPQDHPNVVRVLIGAGGSSRGPRTRDLLVVETNIDDLSPELVPDAVQALIAAGALDAWTAPVVAKKGRPGLLLSALCEHRAVDAIGRVFFEWTTTLGVRSHVVRRTELERRTETVQVSGGMVRVKLGILDGRIVSAKPEHDDVAELARTVRLPMPVIHEEAVAAARALLVAPVDQSG